MAKKSIHQTEDKIAVHYCEYNSDNTLKIKEDPLKHQVRNFYDHNHKNELNQGVQSRLIHDQLGRPIKEVDHVNGKLFKKVVFDGDKKVSHTLYAYDPAGNLIKQTARVMVDGLLENMPLNILMIAVVELNQKLNYLMEKSHPLPMIQWAGCFKK